MTKPQISPKVTVPRKRTAGKTKAGFTLHSTNGLQRNNDHQSLVTEATMGQSYENKTTWLWYQPIESMVGNAVCPAVGYTGVHTSTTFGSQKDFDDIAGILSWRSEIFNPMQLRVVGFSADNLQDFYSMKYHKWALISVGISETSYSNTVLVWQSERALKDEQVIIIVLIEVDIRMELTRSLWYILNQIWIRFL